jgi:FdrA protein
VNGTKPPVGHLEVRSGAYHDSVTLMQVSQLAQQQPGIDSAQIAMATPLNLDLLADLGFEPPPAEPSQLVIALRGEDQHAVDAALAAVEEALSARHGPAAEGAGGVAPPRSIGMAARDGHAGLALVSTPGAVATLDAMDALDAGLNVMVFSDNVGVAEEVALKQTATERGLLVMGPDCGTAVVAGVGLGFANVVRPGPVGIVAASGTGAQHLMCLLDGVDVGVSHCLGVGGRDLSEQVGARSTLRAMQLLADDPAVELIAVISKPPHPTVAGMVRERAGALSKPVVFALLGPGQPDITEAAQVIVDELGHRWRAPREFPPSRAASGRGAYLRGLFVGGTLCDEAMLIATERLGPVSSNIPLRAELALDSSMRSRGHTMIDFGDDQLTAGRAHPMIDGSLRLRRLIAEAADPDVGAIMLDVVLGHGADPDPADSLAPAISTAREARDVPILVSLVGTRDDPQDLDLQAASLCAAGAHVYLSNADATRAAVSVVGG